MSGTDHHLELGSSRFIEGFEDQLVGAEAGESRVVNVRFPDAYANEKLAGRDAVFEVTVKEIRESVPRALDDALAQDLGESDLDALRTKVRGRIEKDYQNLARARVKRTLLDKLAERYEFAVPEGLVGNEFDAIWAQIEEERRQGRNDPEDEGKSDEQLKEEYRGISERRVRLGLLLSEIGRVNGIEVAEEEITRAIAGEASQHPGHEREIFEFYQNSAQAMANVRAPIYENMVVGFILDLATVAEREVSPADLRAETGDEDETESAESAETPESSEKVEAKAD